MNKKIKVSIVLAILLMSIGEYSLAEENKKYEENGMEFTVGKHEPEKRVIPKIPEVTVITKTVVVDKVGAAVLPGEEVDEKLEKTGIITNNIEQEEEGSFSSMIKEVFASIKKLWEKITTFEKKTDDRLSTIENKLEITSDGSDNVEELTDLTEKMLEEIEEQNNRIDELENNKQEDKDSVVVDKDDEK